MIRSDVIGNDMTVICSIVCNAVSDKLQCWSQSVAEDGVSIGSGFNTTGSQTSIDRIRFYSHNAPGFAIDSRLDVYRVNV